MLSFQPTDGEKSSYPTLRASYLALSDEVAFGRVDCCDPQDGAGDGLVSIRGARFECRIHVTGKGRWTYLPADWVMYHAGEKICTARPESGKSYLVEAARGEPSVRLNLEGLGGRFAIHLATEHTPIGEMTWTRRKLLPKPRPPHMVLQAPEMPETRAMFLAWIGLQHWLRLARD